MQSTTQEEEAQQKRFEFGEKTRKERESRSLDRHHDRMRKTTHRSQHRPVGDDHGQACDVIQLIPNHMHPIGGFGCMNGSRLKGI